MTDIMLTQIHELWNSLFSLSFYAYTEPHLVGVPIG